MATILINDVDDSFGKKAIVKAPVIVIRLYLLLPEE